jgi:hypothetical protein
MSTYSQSTTRVNSSAKMNKPAASAAKPFCNACFKAGKDESSYNSHFPKSIPGPNGVVVCPTILAAACKYCGESGHWANETHCPAMRTDAKKNREFERVASRRAAAAVSASQPTLQKVVNRGAFAVLDVDSDSDSDSDNNISKSNKRPREHDIPKPVAVVQSPLPRAGVSWASMAANQVTVKMPERTVYYSQKPVYVPLTVGQKEALKILSERDSSSKKKTFNWIDSDSDSDGEEDEECDNSAW